MDAGSKMKHIFNYTPHQGGVFLTETGQNKIHLTVFNIAQNTKLYQLPSGDFGDYVFILCSSCKECIMKCGIESAS
jgi:hypothetical protein